MQNNYHHTNPETPKTRHGEHLTKADIFHMAVMQIMSRAINADNNKIPTTLEVNNLLRKPFNIRRDSDYHELEAITNSPERLIHLLLEDSAHVIDNQTDTDWLNITSMHGHSILYDAVNIPNGWCAKNMISREKANELTTYLLDVILGEMGSPSNFWRVFASNRAKASELISARPKSDHSLLGISVATGSTDIFNRIVHLYEQHAPDTLAYTIEHPQNGKFSLLFLAVTHGHHAVAEAILNLYDKHIPILKHNSLFERSDAFNNVLERSLLGKNPLLFVRLCQLCDTHGSQTEKQDILEKFRARLLIHTLRSCDAMNNHLPLNILGHLYRSTYGEQAPDMARLHYQMATDPVKQRSHYQPDPERLGYAIFMNGVNGAPYSHIERLKQQQATEQQSLQRFG